VEPPSDAITQGLSAVANEWIEKIGELHINKDFHMINHRPDLDPSGPKVFPALAIPVETKQDYECPLEHQKTLERCVPEVTKMLVIGWRATERRFIDLLCEKLPPDVRIMTVAENQSEAAKSNQRLQEAGIRGRFQEANFGFSGYVVGRMAESFLRS